ncbi:MAG TPA: PDDEXK nuclease domain-containing protein [Candidatus Rifleibacterium sp.]|nr:PDDEXK nuclease domain-containing protein [Candidatus Rifleibacterium sp.]
MGKKPFKDEKFTFEHLTKSIRQAHQELATQTSRAVNAGLTLRNWLIGYYIAEYELMGSDRAKYGAALLDKLSQALVKSGVNACARRQLYNYLRFYQLYPQIVRSVNAQFKFIPPVSMAEHFEKVRSAKALSENKHPDVINRLSYTHIEQLLTLEDDTKRAFYEIECIRGNWSVRELKRQIGSLYYERSGLSHDKKKLSELANQAAEQSRPELTIRDPYIFEFLGLKSSEVMGESHLEDQLIDKLQNFLLEMGQGFCFEARQKRILIGDEYFFVDLVFYHRILKCHILVELKLERFSHENLGQLNTYVNWYRKNMMVEGDNQPLGILLCTDKNHALVEYALAGMDNQLFVSKYQLELPKKEDMERFIEEQIQIAE